MRVNEIFSSLQGEGNHIGYPVLFIRLSGCTRTCSWCDTKYHNEGIELTIDEIVKKIKQSKRKFVVWTGGEPLLQMPEIKMVIAQTKEISHHLETNGDILTEGITNYFDYVCCSPKDKKIAKKIAELSYIIDIKVVTNLKDIGKNMIKYATMLMPFTSEIDCRKEVWLYCNKHNIRYTPRIHYDIWGKKRGV